MKRIADVSMHVPEVKNIEYYSKIPLNELKEMIRKMTFIVGAKMTRTSKVNHSIYNRIFINLTAVAKNLEKLMENGHE